MRWSLALVLLMVAAIATGSAGAAQDARQITYWQAVGSAHFSWTIDYGTNPDSVFNGRYVATLRYQIRTLVSYDGRSISTITRPLVNGSASVVDRMSVWTGGPRTPRGCQERPSHSTQGARRSSGAQVSVGHGRAHIDPGNAIKWAVGCAATESNAIHGLPDGKTISGGARAGAIRTGVACSDHFEHAGPPNAPNGHAFVGSASFSLRFFPIANGQLEGARRALRRQVGRPIVYRGPPTRSYRDCLDTR
jgi:hypothetical protein